MRPLRRDDIIVLGFSLAIIVPTTLGGAAFLWYVFARVDMGSIGLLLAAVWIYFGGRVLVVFLREFLEPGPPHVEAFRDLRRQSPAIERFLSGR